MDIERLWYIISRQWIWFRCRIIFIYPFSHSNIDFEPIEWYNIFLVITVKRGAGMGIYLNQGNELFKQAAGSKVYVDKTMMIDITNSIIDTSNKHICISRPRRFGKSMAADMLTAYYSKGCVIRKSFSKDWKYQHQKASDSTSINTMFSVLI